MKTIFPRAALTAGFVAATCLTFAGAFPAQAGPVSQACLGSSKGAGQTRLCGCIQQVADMTMNRSDQRLAAKIFQEPDRAQEVKMSKRPRDDAFWERYTSFGNAAQAMCS
ncbi:hypothetical protein PSAL_033760 [Pseudooceanicola algae]|uniref:Arginine transporter n=2 Tax=Pseudooceanicola algae TaxID=1537215 RepID=A0A418SI09_9RHOB|nr:hypothetical protein PSAL_033760 [Pseudooceanicola algae]